MESIYLISLIVGGFFVLLSIFGGSDHESEHDLHIDVDGDVDGEAYFDEVAGLDADHDLGFVDLLSIRALFLFAASFGLSGTLLGLVGTVEPLTAMLSVFSGMTVGLGGNYLIKKFAYEQVSSQITADDLKGRTATVILPFRGSENGKIVLEAGGKKIQLTAKLFEGDVEESLQLNDQVVVVRMDGRIAEVLKPD